MPTIKDFSNWLSELKKNSNMVSDSLPLEDTPSENRKYAWVVVNRKCKHCNNECRSLAICKSFLDSSIESRWQTVKNSKYCFSCLKYGHRTIKCYSKRKCEINGCESTHHNLLHRDLNLNQNSTLSDLGNKERYIIKNVYVSSNLNLPTQSLNTSNIRNENSNIDISHCSYDQIKPKMIISLAHAYLTIPMETPQLISPYNYKNKIGFNNL